MSRNVILYLLAPPSDTGTPLAFLLPLLPLLPPYCLSLVSLRLLCLLYVTLTLLCVLVLYGTAYALTLHETSLLLSITLPYAHTFAVLGP
jgi:hypothetical protein